MSGPPAPTSDLDEPGAIEAVRRAASVEEERAAFVHLARCYAEQNRPGASAEALTAAIALDPEPSVQDFLRVARLLEAAGDVNLARDWIDRARWADPASPAVAEALAVVATRQADPVGLADAERWAPAAAARGFCRMGLPDRALVALRGAAGPIDPATSAEVAAALGDEAGVVAALEAEVAAAKDDPPRSFFAGATLEALGASRRGRRLDASRPLLEWRPRRPLSGSERATLGLAAAAPTTVEGPDVAAARAVARLLGAEFRPTGALGGDLARLRFRVAFSAEQASRRPARGRLGLLAAVDPAAALAEEPSLALAAWVLDPAHRGLLGALGLGLYSATER